MLHAHDIPFQTLKKKYIPVSETFTQRTKHSRNDPTPGEIYPTTCYIIPNATYMYLGQRGFINVYFIVAINWDMPYF